MMRDSLLQQVTIIIPTLNRYSLLLRLLKYYKSHGISSRIIILDSSSHTMDSDELKDILDDDNVSYYRYDREIEYAEKLHKGVEKVVTPYCLFCGDDDFVIPMAVEECVNFLQRNSDYSVVHGQYMQYELKASGEVYWSQAYPYKSLNSASPGERLVTYLSDYTIPTFYAVHRTGLLKRIWKERMENTSDVYFGEILLAMITVICGKMKIMDRLYCVRSSEPHASNAHMDNMSDFIRQGVSDEKYVNFKNCLIRFLLDKRAINEKEAGELIDKAMDAYMRGYLAQNFGFKARFIRDVIRVKNFFESRKVTRVPVKLLKEMYRYFFKTKRELAFISPGSESYDDFQKIRHIVET
ncbi:TIGR00180 family glycosyltransferase [bacterium]|nr:TIGR00180 family glycosyltransferase [bacterium]MBU4123807.1 TIGR00180 family glycosyltransferase [bacterium]